MEASKIVIVGAGFGGLSLARKLAGKGMDVMLIDRNNYHTFQPLLYQVATGGLEPDSIAYPIRRIFRGKEDFRFRMAEVLEVRAEQNCLLTSIGELHYDFLVLATGSTNNFFNFEPIKKKLFALKSMANALDIRSYIMQNLEKVLVTEEASQQEQIVNIAIIGGGPAGIEMAGALAEMRKKVLPRDFPEFDFSRMHIYLFEAADKLLVAMSPNASKFGLATLQKMGVEVKLNAKAVGYDGEHIQLENGEKFPTETVIWTAGVKGETIAGLDEGKLTAGNRLTVNAYNQVVGYENVFAIGDVSAAINEKTPKGHPMLAQVAIQQGALLAKNLQGSIAGKAMRAFRYKDKGSMATIGRNKAVVDLPFYRFQGRVAWFLWMFVHLIALVGFRNRIVTFVDWTHNYIKFDRPLGLIIRKYKRE